MPMCREGRPATAGPRAEPAWSAPSPEQQHLQELEATNEHAQKRAQLVMTAGQMEVKLQAVAEIKREMYEAKVRQRYLEERGH